MYLYDIIASLLCYHLYISFLGHETEIAAEFRFTRLRIVEKTSSSTPEKPWDRGSACLHAYAINK